jgi:hypothetical protein
MMTYGHCFQIDCNQAVAGGRKDHALEGYPINGRLLKTMPGEILIQDNDKRPFCKLSRANAAQTANCIIGFFAKQSVLTSIMWFPSEWFREARTGTSNFFSTASTEV